MDKVLNLPDSQFAFLQSGYFLNYEEICTAMSVDIDL